VERFGNKPNGPKISCNKQIQEFRTKQTQAGYLSCNLWVTAKMGTLFRKCKCETPSRIAGISSAFCGLPRKIGALFWRKFENEQSSGVHPS